MLALREKRKRLGEDATEATETNANDTTEPKPDHHGDEGLSIDHDDDASHDDDDSHGDMKQKAKVYPNPSNPTAHKRLITPSRQEEATALMDGYRKDGVEWLEESNRQMINKRYDQSKSSSTHEQPKDGEEEGGDGEQMPTAVKSTATPAAKLDSRRGDMWYMFANEIAKDILGQLDRLIESMHTDPQLGDGEKSALVADVEKFRKASQAYRYKKFYQPAKEMCS